jgi:hypothetical protein
MTLDLDKFAPVGTHILERAKLALEVLHDDAPVTDYAGEKIVVFLNECGESGKEP